jgi:4-amino-4-deoxy-L-arabinose transferase-like glycosyltransferase
VRGRALPIAAIVAIVLVLIATHLPHLSAGLRDYDEGIYWLSLRSMREGNPLFTSVYSSQPPAFLLLTEPPWNWLGGSIEAGRAVMLAWSVIGVGAGAVVGWCLGGRLVGVAMAVLLTVDPRMLDQSIIMQADGPAVSLALLSLAAAALAVTVTGRRWRGVAAVVAGAAMALGVLTKLFDVGVVPALVVVLLAGPRRWASLGLAAAGGVAMAAVVLLPMAAGWGAMWNQAVGLHLSAQTRVLNQALNITFLEQFLRTEWPVVAVAAVGLLIGWRVSRRAWTVGVLWTAGAMAAVAATRPLFPHHMVLVIPGLALLGAIGFAAVVSEIGDRLDQGRLVAVALAAVAAVGCALLMEHALAAPALAARTNTALAARLQALTPASALVIGDDQFDQALAGRDPPPQFVDTSGVRLVGGDITAATVEGVLISDPRVCGILFQSGRLARLPGLVAGVSAELPVHTTLPGGALLETRPACRG